MARPRKITPIFLDLSASEIYTVSEIVQLSKESGQLEKAYPDHAIEQASALAKKAIVSHIHRMGIKPVGHKHDRLAFSGADFPCRERVLQGVEKSAAEDILPAQPKKWRLVALLVAVTTLGLLFFYPKGDPLRSRVIKLKQAGDMEGLLALNRAHVSVRETVPDTLRTQFIDRVADDLGIRVEMNPVQYVIHPYQSWVAEVIATFQDEVYSIEDNLVAVFAGLTDPLWVVDHMGIYQTIKLGSKVRVGDEVGFVTGVTQARLQYQLENGESRSLVREPLELFGKIIEQPGEKSVIYDREEGNLEGLLIWIGEELEQPVLYGHQYPGQVVGYFPSFEKLGEVDQLLRDVNQKRIPIHVGYHETEISYTTEGNNILDLFQQVTPFRLEWARDTLTDKVWFTGQSFENSCAFFELFPLLHQDHVLLVE